MKVFHIYLAVLLLVYSLLIFKVGELHAFHLLQAKIDEEKEIHNRRHK